MLTGRSASSNEKFLLGMLQEVTSKVTNMSTTAIKSFRSDIISGFKYVIVLIFAKIINIYLTGKSSNRNIYVLILRAVLNIKKRLFYA